MREMAKARRPRVFIVAAVARNGVIGRGGRLPWDLPEDRARFRKLTWGHVVVMGRRTYASIGGPLPGRTNVVLSRDPAFVAPGCLVVRSIDEVLARFPGQDVYVIGGAEVYRAFLPLADRLYLTRIDADCEGDVCFPQVDLREWREVSRDEGSADGGGRYPHAFLVYERGRLPGTRCSS